MGYLIVLVCFYFAYNNAKLLMEMPFAQWGMEQYFLLFITIALVVVGVLYGRMVYLRDKKKKQEEAEKKAAAIQEEKKRRAAAAYNDDDDLAYLDELDAEEEARRKRPQNKANGDSAPGSA